MVLKFKSLMYGRLGNAIRRTGTHEGSLSKKTSLEYGFLFSLAVLRPFFGKKKKKKNMYQLIQFDLFRLFIRKLSLLPYELLISLVPKMSHLHALLSGLNCFCCLLLFAPGVSHQW